MKFSKECFQYDHSSERWDEDASKRDGFSSLSILRFNNCYVMREKRERRTFIESKVHNESNKQNTKEQRSINRKHQIQIARDNIADTLTREIGGWMLVY